MNIFIQIHHTYMQSQVVISPPRTWSWLSTRTAEFSQLHCGHAVLKLTQVHGSVGWANVQVHRYKISHTCYTFVVYLCLYLYYLLCGRPADWVSVKVGASFTYVSGMYKTGSNVSVVYAAEVFGLFCWYFPAVACAVVLCWAEISGSTRLFFARPDHHYMIVSMYGQRFGSLQ